MFSFRRILPLMFGSFLLAFCFCLISFAMLGMVGASISDYLGSQDWEITTATVITSEVQATQDTIGTGTDSSESTKYRGYVAYAYTVNDQRYENDQIGFNDSNGYVYVSPETAQNRIADYPIESQVTVYYNPANPNESVLDRSILGDVIFGLMCAAFFVIAIPFIIFFGFLYSVSQGMRKPWRGLGMLQRILRRGL